MGNRKISEEVKSFITERADCSSDRPASIYRQVQDNFKEMQTWIGKIATFTYFERTKAGSYRHPLFKAIRDYE